MTPKPPSHRTSARSPRRGVALLLLSVLPLAFALLHLIRIAPFAPLFKIKLGWDDFSLILRALLWLLTFPHLLMIVGLFAASAALIRYGIRDLRQPSQAASTRAMARWRQ